jgi:DNA polymerase/3'-5' exonuclease PolX
MINLLIVSLQEMSELEDSFFKSRAYKNAAVSLAGMSEDEFKTREDFTDIWNIGSGINNKILEFKETGKISKLEELRKEHSDYLDKKMYKVRKSFITKRIPYEEASKYVELLYQVAALTCDEIPQVAGSYRRKKAYIGDIDLLIDSDDYPKFIQAMMDKYEVLSSGEYKSSFLIDSVNNIQCDVISVPGEERAFQLLYLTGSKEFNIMMRGYAKHQGYKLNQTGLYDQNDDRISGLNEEKDIFEFLKMNYVSPEDR